jgi:hypothetical protein
MTYNELSELGHNSPAITCSNIHEFVNHHHILLGVQIDKIFE